MVRTLKEILNESKKYLQGDFTLEDIFCLIEDTYNLERYQILANQDMLLDDVVLSKVRECVNTPISYILGYKEFYGYKFKVNKNVLIPRYETEELVDMTLKDIYLLKLDNLNIVEVGSGSGCIAITLNKELTKKGIKNKVTSIDISNLALEVAKENNNLLSSEVNFVLGDTLINLPKQKIDILISNPPYIKRGNYVAKRVVENEPELALYAEEDGLEIYHKIFSQIKDFDCPRMYFEISPDLEEGLKRLADIYLNEYKVSFIKDINGLIRFFEVVK